MQAVADFYRREIVGIGAVKGGFEAESDEVHVWIGVVHVQKGGADATGPVDIGLEFAKGCSEPHESVGDEYLRVRGGTRVNASRCRNVKPVGLHMDVVRVCNSG